MQAKNTGKVKFFNAEKGFGFIIQDGGGPDLFFHKTDMGSNMKVTDGTKVRFDVGQGKRGPKAESIALA